MTVVPGINTYKRETRERGEYCCKCSAPCVLIDTVHELPITENIMKVVLQEAESAGAKKVTDIHLVIGDLAGFEQDCVRFYFDILKKGTPAEDAVLEIKQVQARLKCRSCGEEFEGSTSYWLCPVCASPAVEVLEGRDAYIESIEVE